MASSDAVPVDPSAEGQCEALQAPMKYCNSLLTHQFLVANYLGGWAAPEL